MFTLRITSSWKRKENKKKFVFRFFDPMYISLWCVKKPRRGDGKIVVKKNCFCSLSREIQSTLQENKECTNIKMGQKRDSGVWWQQLTISYIVLWTIWLKSIVSLNNSCWVTTIHLGNIILLGLLKWLTFIKLQTRDILKTLFQDFLKIPFELVFSPGLPA